MQNLLETFYDFNEQRTYGLLTFSISSLQFGHTFRLLALVFPRSSLGHNKQNNSVRHTTPTTIKKSSPFMGLMDCFA